MDTGNEEKEWICEHLGHSMNIQIEYYRQTIPTIEMAKIAKLMSALESKNMISTIAGKKLKDVRAESKLYLSARILPFQHKYTI